MTHSRALGSFLSRNTEIALPSLDKLILTHKCASGHGGYWVRSQGDSQRPPLPFPSPPLWEPILPCRETSTRGRGANRDGTSTQGGALRRLPWATFRCPFRAEKRLSVRLSRAPVSSRTGMGHAQFTKEGNRNEFFHGFPFRAEGRRT